MTGIGLILVSIVVTSFDLGSALFYWGLAFIVLAFLIYEIGRPFTPFWIFLKLLQGSAIMYLGVLALQWPEFFWSSIALFISAGFHLGTLVLWATGKLDFLIPD